MRQLQRLSTEERGGEGGGARLYPWRSKVNGASYNKEAEVEGDISVEKERKSHDRKGGSHMTGRRESHDREEGAMTERRGYTSICQEDCLPYRYYCTIPYTEFGRQC